MGPLHPAQAGSGRHQDGCPGAGGAGRRVLHAPRPYRRRPTDHRAAPGHRRDLRGVRPGHRRHHGPAERPVPLDPHRGRSRDLEPPGGGRPVHHRGLRRHPACHPRLPGGRHRGRRDHRRHARDRRDLPSDRRQQGLLQPAPQVQVRGLRLAAARRGARDQRHRLRRREPPRTRPRLRRLGRRRPLHQPQAGRPPRHLGLPRRGPGRLRGRHLDLPRLRLPPHCATAPG